MPRTTLPHRRPMVTVETEWHGHAIAVSVGFDPANANPRAVFATTPRGGALQARLADACFLVSLALQHDNAPEGQAKSLAREPVWVNGRLETAPASHAGAIMDAVLGEVGRTGR